MRINKTKTKPIADPIYNGGTDSVLSGLFRVIMFNLNIDIMKFSRLMDRYIINAGIPYNSKDSTSVRGNLKKELLSDKMSWKVFVKGLIFLNIQKFELKIKLYHHNDIVTEHSKMIVLAGRNDTNINIDDIRPTDDQTQHQ